MLAVPRVVDLPGAHTVDAPLPAAVWRHGGLVDAEDLLQALRRCRDQPLSTLARWIVRGEVASFEWRGRCLLPRFQFSGAERTPLPAVRQVVSELTPVFDDIELVAWFFRPCIWLDDCLPVCAIGACADEVRQAARAERWMARG